MRPRQPGHVRGDLGTLAGAGRQSAALFAELGDSWGKLLTVEPLAGLAQMTGDYPRAARLHEEGLRIAEDLGLWPEAADQLSGLAAPPPSRGPRRGARLPRTGHADRREHSFKPGVIRAETGLALGARRAGRLDAAETQLRHVLQWLRRMSYEPGIALVLAELGFVAEQRGDAAGVPAAPPGGLGRGPQHRRRNAPWPSPWKAWPEPTPPTAARCAPPSSSARPHGAAIGRHAPAARRTRDVDRITAVVRASLDEEAYGAAHRRGAAMTPEEAVAACRSEARERGVDHVTQGDERAPHAGDVGFRSGDSAAGPVDARVMSIHYRRPRRTTFHRVARLAAVTALLAWPTTPSRPPATRCPRRRTASSTAGPNPARRSTERPATTNIRCDRLVSGDVIFGHDGNDTIRVTFNHAGVMNGGNGDDTIRLEEASIGLIQGGAGNDDVIVSVNDEIDGAKGRIHGNPGDDEIQVLLNEGEVDGGEGNDICRVNEGIVLNCNP
ncbi:hypothetical protein SMD44_08551 [Streptomyces alboflavus]|uniref:Calcium-binding protein n=1 Tax=Streptomyces alboflavus TaxID=67267 RepID=A0A1Z1WRN5_9ACTN|nr:calcium-binding protein [Streptomyces alboflavus]ARX89064.1 hypothetical protein SMD44_08551 [Streptomyces alboflavus]